MSILAKASDVATETAPRTRPSTPSSSTISRKFWMALTGIILSGYVLVHMVGNLQAFQGPATIDAYAKLLHQAPALLWGARVVLLAAVGVHIWAYIALTRRNLKARPQEYRTLRYKESTYASRSMTLTGPILLAFIVYHILHMTTGTVHAQFEEGSVYRNVVTGLRVVPVAMVYLVALAALGLHLWHGFGSLFQTLGLGRFGARVGHLATAFTLVVVLGFAAIPIAILAGILK